METKVRMIFISAFCFVLALSYTSSSTESKAKVEELMGKISSAVASDLIQVAFAAITSNSSSVKLKAKLQNTALFAFKRMEPEMKELLSLSGNSTEKVAVDLAHRIDQNKDLKNAFSSDDRIAPRSLGRMFVKAAKIGFTMLDQYLQDDEQQPVTERNY